MFNGGGGVIKTNIFCYSSIIHCYEFVSLAPDLYNHRHLAVLYQNITVNIKNGENQMVTVIGIEIKSYRLTFCLLFFNKK